MKRKILTLFLVPALAFTCVLSACDSGTSGGNGGGNGNGHTNTSQIDDDAHYATDVLHKVNVRETDMPFVTDGETDYSIVAVSDTRAQTAATFIANHLYNATGARVSVEDAGSVSAGDLYSGKYIVLGDETLFEAAGLSMPQEDLGYTGYYIKTLGDDVFIMEDSGFGFGYEHAARAFLSAVVGFEIYSTDMVKYTKSGATMPDMDIIEKPDFEIHRLGFTGSVNDAYAFGSDGGNQMFIPVGGEEWHNTLNYLPYDTYGAAHPLWYESRARQLCVTAHGDADELKEMQETVADIVIDYLDANPDRLIITFTQEDNVYVCGCDECTELKQKYGTDAAAYVIFTNKIAELVDAHYAELGTERDYLLMNFAYQMTEQPPVENVGGEWKAIDDAVMLHEKTGVYIASTVADYSKSFYDEANAVPREQIEGWRALTDNMFIWLYQTNFSWYMLPHNTFEATLETYRFCKSLDMVQINQLGQYSGMQSPTGFHRFKSYFDSQAMFNVNLSYAEITDKFFANYFGPAEEPMRKFFDELVAYMNYLCETDPENVNGKMHCNDHQAKYWPKQLLNHWLNYVDEAYTLIAPLENTDPELYEVLHDHINIESLFPRYALIEFYSGTYPLAEEQAMKISFRDDIRLFNNTYVWEWNSFRGVMNYTFEELFASWGLA